MEEALQIAQNLLNFWRKYTSNTDYLWNEKSGNINGINGTESVKTTSKSQTGNSVKVIDFIFLLFTYIFS